jgi:hypothetical protein
MDLQTPRTGEETLLEPLPVAPSTPSTPSPSATWWRGSSSPLDCKIVEFTCIKLSFVPWWLESHELPIMILTIFILPLWLIFFMRCKDVFFMMYAYVTPFLCACSDQTSMIGLMRGMCALVGVIWWLVWGCDRNPNCYSFYLSLIVSLGRMVYLALNTQWKNGCLVRKDAWCFQHHVIVLIAILYWFLNFTWVGCPC